MGDCAASDRRGRDRLPIDGICCVTLKDASGEETECYFLNLSVGGSMVAVPQGMEPLPVGSCFELYNAPEPLQRLLKGRRATVVWQLHDRCGLCYDLPLPITPDSLHELLPAIR